MPTHKINHHYAITIHVIMILFLMLAGCGQDQKTPDLVPDDPSNIPNYWCTWYWQNYLIKAGEKVTNPDPRKAYSNGAAREHVNETTLFENPGMAKVMLPETRSDYYFLIDHGWQDKSIEKNTFFTMIVDTSDFPSYAHLEPKERIRQLNRDIKELGWRGLGLWVRGTPSRENARKFVKWSKYAGIEYWKIDGGDTRKYHCFNIKEEIYPELTLEYVTGAGGPLNQF